MTSGIFVKPVVFLTVNHRGPLPLRELHSTGETIVWRDPGGSWACFLPVYKCNHPATVHDTWGQCHKQHTKKRGARGNTKKAKITRKAGMWVEEVYEKDPKGSFQNETYWKEPYQLLHRAKPLSNNNSWADGGQSKSPKMKHSNCKEALQNHSEKNRAYKMLRTTKPLRKRVLVEEGLARSSEKQHLENTDKWHLCKAGSFSYGESPRTPPLEGTSLHRWNISVERPWGILSLFTTCLRLCVKSPSHRLWHLDYPCKSKLRGEKH